MSLGIKAWWHLWNGTGAEESFRPEQRTTVSLGGWGVKPGGLKSLKGHRMLHCLLYFEMKGYFNVPTVIKKCPNALGNIPVIWTFYQLMWIEDSTQHFTGLAKAVPANWAAPEHRHSLVGVPCCWAVAVRSCLVWCNPTSLCNGWSQTTPKLSLELSSGGNQPGFGG